MSRSTDDLVVNLTRPPDPKQVGIRRRVGTIVAVNDDGTATVNIAGSVSPAIPFITARVPTAGDTVVVNIERNDPIIIGTIGGTTAFSNLQVQGTVTADVGSFSALNIAGVDINDMFISRPQGTVTRAFKNSGGWYPSAAGSTAIGILGLDFTYPATSRNYRITATMSNLARAAGTGNVFARLNVSYTTNGTTPTISSTLLARSEVVVIDNPHGNVGLTAYWQSGGVFTPGQTVRLLLWFEDIARTTALRTYHDGALTSQIFIDDMGLDEGNDGYDNDGGGTTGTPYTPHTYTKTYYPTWSATYFQDNSRNNGRWGNSTWMYQGQYTSPYPAYNMKSVYQFNYAAITSDLSGATLNSCKFYAHVDWAYYGAGVYGVIGTFRDNAGTPAASYSDLDVVAPNRWRRNPCPVGSWQAFDLGASIGQEFQRGNVTNGSTGMMVGPGISASDPAYYGAWSAYNSGNKPYLVISYTK